MIKTYSLDSFFINKDPVRNGDIATRESVKKGLDEPKLLVELVRKVAEERAEDGTEAILIGCGFFAPFCTMAGLNSVRDGKVPLLDPLLVGLKVAEMMVTFYQVLGVPFRSELSCYEQISTEDLNRIRRRYNLPSIS